MTRTRTVAALAIGAAIALLSACSSSSDVGTTGAAPAASHAAHAAASKAAKPAPKPKPKPKSTPTVKVDFSIDTTAQKLAIQTAVDYLKGGTGFSKKGLYGQLTSSAGEGIKKADALNALKAVESGQLTIDGSIYKVNWDKQAVESAKSYVDGGIVSGRADLLDQLTSDAGEQFTRAQALYAAKKVGLG